MTMISTNRATFKNRRSVLARLGHVYDVWLQRRALNRLDAAALRDVGLTQADVVRELRRPLWDAPQNWRY
ncbi:MAG: DUF1127 domain-containing protein [Sedimentitalea sp.]